MVKRHLKIYFLPLVGIGQRIAPVTKLDHLWRRAEHLLTLPSFLISDQLRITDTDWSHPLDLWIIQRPDTVCDFTTSNKSMSLGKNLLLFLVYSLIVSVKSWSASSLCSLNTSVTWKPSTCSVSAHKQSDWVTTRKESYDMSKTLLHHIISFLRDLFTRHPLLPFLLRTAPTQLLSHAELIRVYQRDSSTLWQMPPLAWIRCWRQPVTTPGVNCITVMNADTFLDFHSSKMPCIVLSLSIAKLQFPLSYVWFDVWKLNHEYWIWFLNIESLAFLQPLLALSKKLAKW